MVKGKKTKRSNVVNRLQKDVAKLKGQVKGQETKQKSAPLTSIFPNDTTGYVHQLDQIAVGDDDYQRDGNSIYHLRTNIRGSIAKNASAATTRVRVLVVKQKTNSVPAFAGVLAETSSVSGIDYGKSYNFGKLSSIIYDRTFVMHAYKPIVPIDITINKKFKVEFSDVAAGNTSYNNLYLMMISDQATNTPAFTGRYRYSYRDD